MQCKRSSCVRPSHAMPSHAMRCDALHEARLRGRSAYWRGSESAPKLSSEPGPSERFRSPISALPTTGGFCPQLRRWVPTSARRCLVHWTPARPVPYIGAVGTHLIVASSSKRPSAFTAAAVTASAAPHADASGAWICMDDEVRRPDRHCSEIRIGDFVALGHVRTFATACACGPSQER